MSRRTGRRLRTLTAAGFLLMTAAGLAWHTGWGTPSSFGWREIAEVCPLGALEAMIADRTFIPRAFVGLLVFFAITVLLGRIFCGWVCPVPLIRRFTGGEDRHAAAEAPSPLPQGDSSSPKDERTSCDEASCGDPSCASREALASQCRICGAAKAKTSGSEALPEKGPL